MAGYKVDIQLFLAAEAHKLGYPLNVTNSADSGSSHLKALIKRLYSVEAQLKQLEILLHIRLVPKAGQVRLVPDLNGVFICLLAIPLDKMA